jgi:hypothetical protein
MTDLDKTIQDFDQQFNANTGEYRDVPADAYLETLAEHLHREGWRKAPADVIDLTDRLLIAEIGNAVGENMARLVRVQLQETGLLADRRVTFDDGGWSLPDGYDADSYDADGQR